MKPPLPAHSWFWWNASCVLRDSLWAKREDRCSFSHKLPNCWSPSAFPASCPHACSHSSQASTWLAWLVCNQGIFVLSNPTTVLVPPESALGPFGEKREEGGIATEGIGSWVPWGLMGSVLIQKGNLLVTKTWHLDSTCFLKQFWIKAEGGAGRMEHTLLGSWIVGVMTSSRGRALLGLRPPGRLQVLIMGYLLRSNRLEKKPKKVRGKSKGLAGGFPTSLKAAIHSETLRVVQA